MLRKISKLVLGFSAGLLSGSFIRLGFEIIGGRPASVGGEALILPLIIILLYFGYSLGKETKVKRNFRRAYKRGYYAGYDKGKEDGKRTMFFFHPNCRCSISPANDRTGQ